MCQSKQELRASWKFWFKQSVDTLRGDNIRWGSLMLLGVVSGLLLGDCCQEHSVPGISVCPWDFCPVVFSSLPPVVSPGTFSVPSERFFYTCKSSLPWLCTEQRLMSRTVVLTTVLFSQNHFALGCCYIHVCSLLLLPIYQP